MTSNQRSSLSSAELARFATLGAASIYMAQGCRGALGRDFAPLSSHTAMAALAFTLDAGSGDDLTIHRGLLVTPPGSVLVIDGHDEREIGVWGSLLTHAATRHSLAGVVLSGAVHESRVIGESELPVFAKAIGLPGASSTHAGSMGATVVIDGIRIATGDLIVADRDGVVVVSATQAVEVLRSAEAQQITDEFVRDRVTAGASTFDLLGLGNPRQDDEVRRSPWF